MGGIVKNVPAYLVRFNTNICILANIIYIVFAEILPNMKCGLIYQMVYAILAK